MSDKLLVDKDWIALNGISYNDYYKKIQNFVSEKTTSGQDVTAERIEITKLNLHRMKRINEAQKESLKYELPFSIGAAILTEACALAHPFQMCCCRLRYFLVRQYRVSFAQQAACGDRFQIENFRVVPEIPGVAFRLAH